MSKRKFTYCLVFMVLAFFVAVTSGGCGGGSDGSSGSGSGGNNNSGEDGGVSVNINNENVVNIPERGGITQNITNNNITNNITNNINTIKNIINNNYSNVVSYMQNINTIALIINFNNNEYDNSKTVDYDDIVASEDAGPEIDEPEPVTATTLSGHVWKSVTYTSVSEDYLSEPEPVRGASVTISWGDGSRETKTTGTDGTYSFWLDGKAGFEYGYAHYSMDVTAEGYRDFTGEIDVEEHTQQEVNISLVGRLPASGTFTARDAQSNNTVSGVEVTVFEGWNTSGGTVKLSGITDSEGNYEYTGIEAGYYTVRMSKQGYIDTEFNVTLDEGDGNISNGYLSREMNDSNEFRAVLTWGIYPTDLDAHLYGKTPSGSEAHVYYAGPSGSINGKIMDLDRDDVTSYGPETITFKADGNASYEYFVHWYSWAENDNYDWSRTEVKVDLYNGDEHIGTYTASPETTGQYRYWRVFSITNGTPETLNTYTSAYNSITDSY